MSGNENVPDVHLPDHMMRIQAEALEHDKAEFVLESGIRDSEGEIVAHTTSVYQVRVLEI
jgi:hypothetical protein